MRRRRESFDFSKLNVKTDEKFIKLLKEQEEEAKKIEEFQKQLSRRNSYTIQEGDEEDESEAEAVVHSKALAVAEENVERLDEPLFDISALNDDTHPNANQTQAVATLEEPSISLGNGFALDVSDGSEFQA